MGYSFLCFVVACLTAKTLMTPNELTDRTTDMNKPRLQGSTQRLSPVRCSALLDHVLLIHKNLSPQWQRNQGRGIENSKPSEHSIAKHSAANTVSGGTNQACAV